MLHNADDIEELASLYMIPTSLSLSLYTWNTSYTYMITSIDKQIYPSSLSLYIRIRSLCVYMEHMLYAKHKVANRRFLLSDLQPPHCQREPLSHARMAAAKAMRFGSSRRPSTGDASTTATRIRKSPVSLIMSNSSCRNYLKKHPYIPAFIHLQYHRANFYKISDLGLRPRAEIPMLIP